MLHAVSPRSDHATWAIPPQPGSDVVCHGDPGPWNMVWDGPRAIGLIDWDLAHPAPAMGDVAYALEHFTPFRSDEVACDTVDGHHFPAPPDRRARLSAFASAYGLDSTAGLVDRVIDRQAATITHVQDLAERQSSRSVVGRGGLSRRPARRGCGGHGSTGTCSSRSRCADEGVTAVRGPAAR